MKHILSLLLATIVLIGFAFPAAAANSTEEKSRQYQAAINELETYLETNDSSIGNLYGIQAVFASLGGFEQSKSLNYYTTVLIKLSEETYDFDLVSALELLNMNQSFKDYLSDPLKGSPLRTVEELESYAEGREKEHADDPESAMDCYENCMSFFDATERYQSLRELKYREMYDQALEMQNTGDLAGAYYLFSDISPFEQSDDRKAVIEKLLGYTPESPTDNLLPVTDVEVTSTQQGEITLGWAASAHAKNYEVQYKESGNDSWVSSGETEKTKYTISGLIANTDYDFRIISAIGKIKVEGPTFSVNTGAVEMDEPSPESNQPTNPVSVPWPIIEIDRKAVAKTGAWDDSQVFGYYGPGRDFMSVAYFRWAHINDPYSLFTLGEYTLIDFTYPTRPDWHGRISAFISTNSIINRSGTIDMEELKLESYPATLLQKTTPRFGPGEEYALISDDMYIISNSVEIESGSSVLVCFEANDWLFIEFTCQKKEDNKTITGTARGWIPKACVNYPEESIIGLWHMTEARKNAYNDVISFDVNIISVDENGKMEIDWGGSGRINGDWNSEKNALTVFKDQTYVLHNGILGGGNSQYSGIAIKDGATIVEAPDSILGEWSMTEYRKEKDKNDIIQFTFNIVSISEAGKVDVYWGDSVRTTGEWNEQKQTLTVYKEQVYVLHEGIFGGGSRRLSGVATHN